jgi:SnoaL-like domain
VSYEAGQLADLEEIKTLSYRYALGLDRFDIEGILSVFAPDGVFDMSSVGLPRMEGRESMREFFSQRTLQVMASQVHLFGTHVIEFDGADEAHATNYLFQDGHSKEGHHRSDLRDGCRQRPPDAVEGLLSDHSSCSTPPRRSCSPAPAT